MLKCSRCKGYFPESLFYKRPKISRGHHYYCKPCHSLYSKKRYRGGLVRPNGRHRTYPKYKDLSPEQKASYRVKRKRYDQKNKEKIRAQSAVCYALKVGKLIRPSECSQCGKKVKVEGHHPDHSRKLEVVWVCRTCHLKIHAPERPHDGVKKYITRWSP